LATDASAPRSVPVIPPSPAVRAGRLWLAVAGVCWGR